MKKVSTSQGYRLTVEGKRGDAAVYLYFPDTPQTPGCVARTVRLHSLLAYTGPEINLDFDATGAVIGIEILD
ncbi:MAG: DUF2283 domain-containing protein [Hyphomonadaceae bacterium]